jgi:thioredoxin-related protein
MRVTVLLIFICIGLTFKAQNESGLVNWLTFKEAQEKNKTAPKPFLVDIYTDWCGWCKHMMKTTYSNPGIAGYINQNFYPVKFNAETKDTVEYNGKKYFPTSKEPKTPHQLAVKFLGTSLTYPSTFFITNNFEFNLLSQGYMDEKKLEPLLIFLVENVFRTTQYEDFSERFTKSFYDTMFPKKQIKTYSIQEAIVLMKTKPKKILVNIYADFCNSCRVQTKSTFVDTSIASYIEKNFYLVNFSAESNDTIIFRDEKCFKQLISGYPLNTFAFKATNGRLVLPSLAILNEKLETVETLNMYQHPKNLKPVLVYFGSNYYKTQKWPDFIADYFKPKKKT